MKGSSGDGCCTVVSYLLLPLTPPPFPACQGMHTSGPGVRALIGWPAPFHKHHRPFAPIHPLCIEYSNVWPSKISASWSKSREEFRNAMISHRPSVPRDISRRYPTFIRVCTSFWWWPLIFRVGGATFSRSPSLLVAGDQMLSWCTYMCARQGIICNKSNRQKTPSCDRWARLDFQKEGKTTDKRKMKRQDRPLSCHVTPTAHCPLTHRRLLCRDGTPGSQTFSLSLR